MFTKDNIYTYRLGYASIFTDYPRKDAEESYKQRITLLTENTGRLKPRDYALKKQVD